ncbi:hypothetical protein PQI66_03195 [Corynebacterium sp. USCH3]|uniref:hypothetical protein n=1 Tax=Corynebacterium sp. USCH3 TaxID=3024840 RepID=UPI0030A5F800
MDPVGMLYDFFLGISVNMLNGIIDLLAFLPGNLDQQYIAFVPDGTANWNGHRYEV